ncbi:MAG: EamA family transporter [Chloroflexi bacterium]|nr:EamA family transporter [Chloroflexota bacterium]
MVQNRLLANGAALTAAIIFGTTPVVTRVLVQDIPPLSLAVLRSGQGALILWLGLIIGGSAYRRMERRDLPFTIVLGAIVFASFPTTYNFGFRFTEASRGTLLLSSVPAISALLAGLLGRERLAQRQVAGVAVAFAGVALVIAERGVSGPSGNASLLGDGLLLLTALSQAVYSVSAKSLLARYRAVTVTAYAMAAGALILLPIALQEGLLGALPRLDTRGVLLLLFLGVFGGAVGYFCWNFGLTHLSPPQVAIYINLAPAVGAFLGATLLGEQLTMIFFAGFVTVLFGVLLVNWPRRKASMMETAVVHLSAPD